MTHLGSSSVTSATSLEDLIGLARAIEDEAAARYRWLAAEMRRRGETAAADAFETLATEEGRHIDAVASWARNLGVSPPAGDFQWRLPKELAGSWDDAAASSLLSPYRAYAIAVENEERAFAFYAYLAAAADDRRVADQAEVLAREELRHAALIRVWRRAAFHRERRRATEPATMPVADRPGLEAAIAGHEAAIAASHAAIAERLRDVGDVRSADLVATLAGQARQRAADGAAGRADAACAADGPAALLLAAQRPLEVLCELLESAMTAAPDEATQAVVQAALESAVSRVARIGRRLEEVLGT